MAKLLRSCREEEARYLIRALCRNMRIGANTTTILGALAHAVVQHERSQKKVDDGGLSSGGEVGDGGGSRPTGGVNVRKKGVGKSGAVEGDDKDELKAAASTLCEAYAMCPSFDVLVPALIQGGISGVASSCVLTPGTPVKPMLAKVSTGVDDLFAQVNAG
jgi:DNA ligase-1